MTVKYKDGEKKIIVPLGTPIVRYEIGSRSELKPGAHVTVLAATKKPDGTFEANRINVGLMANPQAFLENWVRDSVQATPYRNKAEARRLAYECRKARPM